MEGTSDMERKGCESIGCWARYVILTFELTHNIELGFSRSFFFSNSHISGMGGPNDIEQKGYESDGSIELE